MSEPRTLQQRAAATHPRDLDNVIEVQDLHRRYGGSRRGFDAVRGVSFSVREGELFALLGTNGAGKTSTVEVLEGLAPATSGSVRVLGHDPFVDRRHVRPHTGVVLQQGGLSADLSVSETVAMWAGTLTRARPVQEALDLVDLSGRARVAVKQLSGGERRRLDLALAVVGRPSLLFLDEPTAGLDPESRVATWALVRHLLDEGTTVLLTTHYLEEAAELADRLAIMHAGRIVRSGTPAEVAATEPARVTFALDAAALPLPQMPRHASVSRDVRSGTSFVTITTPDLQPALALLLSWAQDEQVLLRDLHARPASLQEAFLALAADTASDVHRGTA
jgi:ABC-2 type transport system ATP-binding protein